MNKIFYVNMRKGDKDTKRWSRKFDDKELLRDVSFHELNMREKLKML